MDRNSEKTFSAPFERQQLRRLGHLTLIYPLIGLVAGLGAAGFFVMLEAGREVCLGYLANYRPATPGFEEALFDFGSWRQGGQLLRWMLLIIPAVGGLVSGLIVFALAPEAEGHGTDAAIEAYHFKDGFVRARVPFIKAITSMITIGTGGSAGREGPIAQIGSGFGSMLGRWLNVPPNERRVLMAAGMAAGIGAIFHAPLAGALFAAEVMYRGTDFEHETLVPAFISSIIAYSVFGWIYGFHPLFCTPAHVFDTPAVLLPYLLLALVAAFGAMLYVRAFYGFRGIMFGKLRKIPNHFKPAIGGLLVGGVGFFLPEALGTGYGVVQMCFNGQDALATLPSASVIQQLLPAGTDLVLVGALLLAMIAISKIFTTAFTVGSGGSGGVFGPAITIGGALGGATGLVCTQLFPNLPIQPGAFALVGMAGFFAGAANTPVSTIIMVSEMTGNYNLLVPSMLVCVIAFVLCRRHTLYEKQLSSRLEAPSKLGNMASAILRRLTVQQALPHGHEKMFVTVNRDTSLTELTQRFAQSTQACFPVVDTHEQLLGMIDADDIRRVITETGMGDLIIARDIEIPAATVTSDDSLLAAINTLVRNQSNELIVIDKKDPRQLIATLSRSDIIATYNRQVVEGAEPVA